MLTFFQEEKKKAAEARRKEDEERQQAAKARQDLFASPSLFERPKKVSNTEEDHDAVAQVLGSFHKAQHIMHSHGSCIGVDYQPPTPAPVSHIIGGKSRNMVNKLDLDLSIMC